MMMERTDINYDQFIKYIKKIYWDPMRHARNIVRELLDFQAITGHNKKSLRTYIGFIFVSLTITRL